MFDPKPDEKLVQVTVYLSEEELRDIEDIMDMIKCKKANLIRQMIQFALKNRRQS